MGYRRNRTVPLVFTSEEMAGFTATAKVITTDEWLEVAELVSTDGFAYLPYNRDRIARMHELLAGSVVEWNLEDDNGATVPFSLEAFKAQDKWFQAAIVDAWVDQMVQVNDPLERPSSNGPAEGLADLPMTETPTAPDAPASLAS